ncbi:hypothetical protein AKO1_012916 [Acrasis kona]|uniref:Anoctamin transmembrane domain-containing protein n=1 Tax=Acrasis kona TaxID=1008807 RepID=A0AAW2YMK0_9EUKA
MSTIRQRPVAAVKAQAEGVVNAVEDVIGEMTKKQGDVSIFSSWTTIRETYGVGVYNYFKFAKDIALLHIPLLGLQLYLYWVTYTEEGSTFSIFPSDLTMPYLNLWRLVNVICIFLTFAFPITYFFKTKFWYDKENIIDGDSSRPEDVIKENVNYTFNQRALRFLLSYAAFFAMYLSQIVLLVTLDVWQTKLTHQKETSGSTTALTFAQLAASIGLTISRSAFDFVAPMLTDFEKHRSKTDVRRHNCFKLVLFRLASLFIMTFMRGYYATDCAIDVLGNVYLVHVIFDLVLSNILEWASPIAAWMFSTALSANKDAEDNKPEWDTDQEYLEIICRQYMIYAGLPSFPMVALFGLVIAFLEVYLDLARLIYVCKKPRKTNSSMKGVTVAYLLLAAALSVLNWGGGSLYTMTGSYYCNPHYTKSNSCTLCPLFSTMNQTTFQ